MVPRPCAWRGLKIETKIAATAYTEVSGAKDTWGDVTYYVEVPDGLQPNDNVSIYAWNPGGASPLLIDDMKIEVCAKK